MRYLIPLIVVILSCLDSHAEDCSFDVGMIIPLTGNASPFGERTRQGAEVARATAKEFLGECKLNIYYEDSAWAAAKAVNAFKSLTARRALDAIITGASHVSLAVAPLAIEKRLPQIAIYTSAESFSSPNDLSIRMSPRAKDDVTPFIEIIKGRKLTPGALFIANDFGEQMSSTFDELLKAQGLGLSFTERFTGKDSDFRSTLLRMKSKQISAVLIVGLPSHYSQILRQSKEIGFTPYFLSPRTAEDPSLAKLGELTEKLLYTNPFDDSARDKETTVFIRRFQERFSYTPDSYAAEGFESVRIIARSWAECSGESDCIEEKLLSGAKHNTVFGPLQFDRNGDTSFRAVVKRFVDGKPEKLEG